jgi:hypothetical protein
MEAPAALTNTSSYLPSPADLLMVFPRLFAKASAIGDMMRAGGSAIASPTMANVTNSTVMTTAGQFVQESVAAAAASVAASPQEDIGMFQALKNVASFFSYITSKWAIATFAIVSPAGSTSASNADRTRIGHSLESNPLLRIQSGAPFFRPFVAPIRYLHRASASLRLSDPIRTSSYALPNFARVV